jgi:hypothetical protein
LKIIKVTRVKLSRLIVVCFRHFCWLSMGVVI